MLNTVNIHSIDTNSPLDTSNWAQLDNYLIGAGDACRRRASRNSKYL